MKSGRKIDISVVIPAHNEEQFLPKTLRALQKQDFKGSFEVIVVDNDSSDRTAAIGREFDARVIHEGHHGVAWARQAGFRAARGKIIVSTDADTLVRPDWLTRVAEVFTDPIVVGFSGNIELFGSKSFKAALLNLFLPLIKIVTWYLSGGGCFWGANFALRRSIFERSGGFNLGLVWGEDVELGFRVRRLGKIVLKNSIKVATSARRYEASRLNEILRFYFLNFFSLAFFHKPYSRRFTHIRSAHNPEVTAKKLKVLSVIVGGLLLAVLVLLLVVRSATSPRGQLMGRNYWHVKTKQKIIALTFDDGPNEPYTSDILAVLDRYGVKATFFEVGENVERNPAATTRLYNDGQVIANHSYSHELDLALQNKRDLKSEIEKTQGAINAVIGHRPALFRPPHGFKGPMMMEEAKRQGLIEVGWSDMTDDYWRPGTDKIVKRVLTKARPGGIIVLHDGGGTQNDPDRSQTVAAAEKIIETLQSEGYRFVTVPELLNVAPYQ